MTPASLGIMISNVVTPKLDVSRYAGRIYYLLETQEGFDVDDLMKLTNFNKIQVFAALGWLARDNRIVIQIRNDEDWYISLNRHPMNEIYFG